MTPSRIRDLALLMALPACGAVELPEEHLYRLALTPKPGQSAASERGAGVRVAPVVVAAHLDGEEVLVATGPVRLRSYRYHRWAAPVGYLVEDVLVEQCARSGAFTQVLASAEAGAARYELRCRVSDLHHDALRGLARVDVALAWFDTHEGALVRDVRRSVEEPLADADPATAVEGMARGLARVVAEFVRAPAAP